MGAVIFSDVHADAAAIENVISCIREPSFGKNFGTIDFVVNLGDLVHRGIRPRETLEAVHTLAREFPVVSVLGNHDHAFVHGIIVSGSDSTSSFRHEQLRGSPLTSIFDTMPMEYISHKMLFVHGGPLELGNQTLRLKCWQRLSHEAGDFFTGYHYTAQMAFEALNARGLSNMCCGHQHSHICCRKTPKGIIRNPLEFRPFSLNHAEMPGNLEFSRIPLDDPTILRVGGCHGPEPEFAYTDFSTFTFIRIRNK